MYADFRAKRKAAAEAAGDSASPNKVKLTYFNLMGRGETIRLILAAGGVDFEDKRVEFSEWPALKPNVPWNTLPTLEVDGKELGQSIAICRATAQMTGLAGADNFEQALVDSVGDVITDIREKHVPCCGVKDEDERKEKVMAFFEGDLPKLMASIEDFYDQNGGTYLVGDKMTWADLHFVGILEWV